MTKRLLLSMFLVGFLFSFTQFTLWADTPEVEGSNYAHISYVDGDAKVIHEDQAEHEAVVNLPVVPGDVVVTGEKGRCEVQFDNGTIIRLDQLSRLKVTTILAPSLTTNWRITTLRLQKGNIYVMNKIYSREKFQVITTNAAIDLNANGITTLQLKENGDTEVFVDRGKSRVMFGPDIKSLSTEKLSAGHFYTITSDHQLKLEAGKKDIDFYAWNDYVNRNFKDLHAGISKLPKKIYHYNKALVYWAEKWSSMYGEWVYDEIFGYVWKPGDEIFSYSKRPFFHANYVTINGKLFVVPQQPWGWVPAHLGTWVWMKWGWTWVPGNYFNYGIAQEGSFYYPTLSYWMDSIYGGCDLYYLYRQEGSDAWRNAYRRRYNVDRKNPEAKSAPSHIRSLIKKLDNTQIQVVRDRLGSNGPEPTISNSQLKTFLKSPVTSNSTRVATVTQVREKSKSLVKSTVLHNHGFNRSTLHNSKATIQNFRDFNPDIKWSIQYGEQIGYSSRGNSVICPSLKLDSRSLSHRERSILRNNNSISSFHGDQGSSSSGDRSSTGSSAIATAGSIKDANKK